MTPGVIGLDDAFVVRSASVLNELLKVIEEVAAMPNDAEEQITDRVTEFFEHVYDTYGNVEQLRFDVDYLNLAANLVDQVRMPTGEFDA